MIPGSRSRSQTFNKPGGEGPVNKGVGVSPKGDGGVGTDVPGKPKFEAGIVADEVLGGRSRVSRYRGAGPLPTKDPTATSIRVRGMRLGRCFGILKVLLKSEYIGCAGVPWM